jgi:hypothetical protein
MSHATGQGEDVIAKLLRKVLYVGAFAYIIGNFNWLAGIVFRSFAGLGLTASGSTMTHGELPAAGRLAKTGIDAGRRSSSRSARWLGFPEVFVNIDAHRGAVPRLAGGHPVLLRAGGAALHHADRVQADHAGGLRAGAVRALEQDRVPGREGAGQRGVVGHQGAGAGRHRRHRLGPVRRVPGARPPSLPSTMRWSSCWPRWPCWRWASSGRASPRAWCPVRRSSARARWPVLLSALPERLLPSAPRRRAWAVQSWPGHAWRRHAAKLAGSGARRMPLDGQQRQVGVPGRFRRGRRRRSRAYAAGLGNVAKTGAQAPGEGADGARSMKERMAAPSGWMDAPAAR